jgi:large subunit ribosomal protein L24e
MPICSFCKKSYNFPKGLTVFTFDGKSLYFCSSKCRRNLALKRDPRKVEWVKRTGRWSHSRVSKDLEKIKTSVNTSEGKSK